MRYRKLSPTGDYVFGGTGNNFYINVPQAVAQAVQTRLALWAGQWFLDTTDGTDWNAQVLGNRTQGTRDAVIRARILGTPGVTALTNYSSQTTDDTRQWTAQGTVTTQYGQTSFEVPA